MKKITFTLLSLLCAVVYAQDQQLLAERDIIGTARYVGMAGAMTAVGGDPSAVVQSNPAGVGVYRRLESMITLDLQMDRTRQYGEKNWEHSIYFIPSQVSANFAFGDDSKTRGVIYHNLMISYSRLKNWHRTYAGSLSTVTDNSIIQRLAADVQGVPASQFNDQYWADNPDITWLSEMAYKEYLLDYSADSSTLLSYVPTGYGMGQASKVIETGYTNQFSVNWGMNISNRYFFGIGLGIQSLYLRKDVYYSESYAIQANYPTANIYNYLKYSGIGVNGSIGVIARPIKALRIGFSLVTPTIMSMKISHYGTMDAFGFEQFQGPDNTYTLSDWTQPLRTSIGIAAHLPKDKGLISIQYDYQHVKNANDIHTLRAGLEWVPTDKLYINAGYAFSSMFKDAHYVYALQHGDIRTDTDTRNVRWNQYASFGIGYRGTFFIAQAAYQCGWDNSTYYAHELSDNYDWRSFTHRVVLTFAFHSR